MTSFELVRPSRNGFCLDRKVIRNVPPNNSFANTCKAQRSRVGKRTAIRSRQFLSSSLDLATFFCGILMEIRSTNLHDSPPSDGHYMDIINTYKLKRKAMQHQQSTPKQLFVSISSATALCINICINTAANHVQFE
ncbi:hypothetical protein BGZ82_001034 [Podila clonocystis]|nr:hypothetical protein BGZ82_001034 [Podila clonocystis]